VEKCNSIWKFQIAMVKSQQVTMPADARILSVQFQGLALCLWVLVDPNESVRLPREIQIFGTGHPLPSYVHRYIGTVQQHDGRLVWHVFEVQ
jgi:hypothetical protein